MRVKLRRINSILCKNPLRVNSETVHYLFLFLLIVPIFEPEGINAVAPFLGSTIWGFYSKVLSAGILTVAFLITTARRKRIDIYILYIIAFVVTAGMISLLKLQSLGGFFSRYLCIISAIFLVVTYQHDLKKLTKTIMVYLEILIAINFILVLIYPDGMYNAITYTRHNWLLGYKSSLQYYVVPAIAFAWLDAEYGQSMVKRIHFYFLLGLSIVEAALCKNAMLLIGLIFEATCIALKAEKRTSLFNGFTYFFVSFVFNIVILFFVQILLNMPLVQMMLMKLGKNNNFTGRIDVIWPRSIKLILRSPLLGYGVLTYDQNSIMLANLHNSGAIHAHNHLLQILLDGGIILFGIYLIFTIIIVHRMIQNKEFRSSQVLGMSVFILLIMSTVEIFTRNCGTGMWMLLILCGMSKQIDYQFSRKDVGTESTSAFVRNH